MKAIEGGKTKMSHPNARVNGAQGHETFAKGSPKVMDAGMDLSGDATNCIGKKPSLTVAESPVARSWTNEERHG